MIFTAHSGSGTVINSVRKHDRTGIADLFKRAEGNYLPLLTFDQSSDPGVAFLSVREDHLFLSGLQRAALQKEEASRNIEGWRRLLV